MENKLTRRGLLSALSMWPAAGLLVARQSQDSQQLPTLKRAPNSASDSEEKTKPPAEAKPINVFVTVREKSSGKLIKDLTQDDFTLEDEGKPQTIKVFEAGSSLPLNLGFLVDTGYRQARSLGDERTAGVKFFDQVLHDKDQAFVIHFDHDIELLQDFTNSRDKLDRALNLLGPAQPQQQQTQQQGGNYPQGGGYPGGGYPGGGGRRYPQGGYANYGPTKLYDAIMLASDELMSKQKDRKALILLGGGVDSGSKTTLFEAIRAAQKANTLVHSVLFEESQSYGNPGYGGMGRRGGRMPPPSGQQGPDGKKILQQISQETGGTFNSVGSFHHLDKIFADIQEELGSQYNIGYTPDTPSEQGLFRHIHITAKLKKKELVVLAPAGYYVQ